MMKNTCGIEAFMSAFQASIVCLHYLGPTHYPKINAGQELEI